MYHGFAGNGGPTLLCPLGVFDLKRFELSCCCSFAFPFCFLSQAVEGACAWPAASGGAAPGRHPRRACDQTHARGQDRAGGPWQVGRARTAASAGGGTWTKRSGQAWLAEFEVKAASSSSCSQQCLRQKDLGGRRTLGHQQETSTAHKVFEKISN